MAVIPFFGPALLGLPGGTLHRRDPLSSWSLALAERACRRRKGQSTYEPALEYFQWKYDKALQRNALARVRRPGKVASDELTPPDDQAGNDSLLPRADHEGVQRGRAHLRDAVAGAAGAELHQAAVGERELDTGVVLHPGQDER
jgi:hypothetical protein